MDLVIMVRVKLDGEGVAAALGNGKAPRTPFPLQSKKSTPRYPMRKLQRFVPILIAYSVFAEGLDGNKCCRGVHYSWTSLGLDSVDGV
jgi:hypothetical protein